MKFHPQDCVKLISNGQQMTVEKYTQRGTPEILGVIAGVELQKEENLPPSTQVICNWKNANGKTIRQVFEEHLLVKC